jgi:hypothetical protein
MITDVDQVKEDAMGRACSTHGGEEECIYDFGGNPEGKRPLGRPRLRWEDNITKGSGKK